MEPLKYIRLAKKNGLTQVGQRLHFTPHMEFAEFEWPKTYPMVTVCRSIIIPAYDLDHENLSVCTDCLILLEDLLCRNLNIIQDELLSIGEFFNAID